MFVRHGKAGHCEIGFTRKNAEYAADTSTDAAECEFTWVYGERGEDSFRTELKRGADRLGMRNGRSAATVKP